MSDDEPGRGLTGGLTNYGDRDFARYLRRSFAKSMGYTDASLDKPIVGICYTESGFNNCHRDFPHMLEAVKRGVLASGALPVVFPVISLGEVFLSPTSMNFRNLMAMDVEEMIRAQPMDAVVLIGGCDKTVPALLMGAASADVPAILTVTGPMITGSHKGERLGACTDCRRLWGQHRAGNISESEIEEISGKLAPGPGTCMVMGTASTMALVAEAMGMMLPGGAAIPAVHADRMRHAEATGARAVAIAAEGLRPTQIMTKASMRNALRILQAVGGSTNGVVHLAALAGRLGFDLDLEELDSLGAETPVLVDLKPSGQHYMEDLFRAGGLVTVLREIDHLIDRTCLTVTGRTLGEDIDAQPASWAQEAVRPLSDPIHSGGGIRLLRGNLAPNGAIIKQAAASPALLRHKGRAVVFTSLADMAARLDDPALDVRADDILVLQNAGPKGAPGMPEAGYIPIPKKLAAAGVKDMVRISDARMSGTAFGAIVLHISPEAAAGGPLGLVRDGDQIALDVEAGTLSLLVSDAELQTRRAEWSPPDHVNVTRGYAKLYFDEVLQAEDGCDFNFLRAIPRDMNR